MKKTIIVISIFILNQVHFAQGIINPSANDVLDESINTIWNQSGDRLFIQDVGPESLGGNNIIAPLIPPARSRQIPEIGRAHV